MIVFIVDICNNEVIPDSPDSRSNGRNLIVFGVSAALPIPPRRRTLAS